MTAPPPYRRAWHALPHAGLALLLACGTPAFATGSMLCQSPSRTVEIQMRLTADTLLGLRVTQPAAPGADAAARGEHFDLERQAVDFRRRRLNAAGRGLEELGYRLGAVRKVFEAFMNPGSVTEKLHFFVAPYDAGMRIGDGGGLADEGEDIEVLELPIDEALAMVADGRIVDAKTILLLHHAQLHLFAPDGP